jgi:CheY-like chemotaxis protein
MMRKLKSILLIEDDKDDQFFFIEALNEIGNANIFDIVNNGKEALSKLEKSVILPDLIFTDINMPVMNGLECLSEIMRSPRLRNIPVVILSTDTGTIELVRILGAKAFIKKPVDSRTLREEIERMVNMNFTRTRLPDPTFRTALNYF